jgi:cytidylate kinase
MSAGKSGGDSLPKLTVSGKPGSGTSTLVDLLSEHRRWDSVNGGDIFRQEAQRRNLSVEDFSSLCKEDLEVDRSLDDTLKELISSTSGPSIVESRLSGWWAHLAEIDCLRIWIEVSDEERARRIQSREGGNYEDVLRSSLRRNSDDMERYQKLYGIDLDDMSPYNMIIEADGLDASQVMELVQKELRT